MCWRCIAETSSSFDNNGSNECNFCSHVAVSLVLLLVKLQKILLCSRVCRTVWTGHTSNWSASVWLLSSAILITDDLDAFYLWQTSVTPLSRLTASAACHWILPRVRTFSGGRSGCRVRTGFCFEIRRAADTADDASVSDAALRRHGHWFGRRFTRRRGTELR